MTYASILDPFFAQWNVRIRLSPTPSPWGWHICGGDTWVMLRFYLIYYFKPLYFVI